MKKDSNSNDYCIILAGGKGRRLWPSSRSEMPKQFMDFFGTGVTLLQNTYQRITHLLPEDHIYVCTSAEYRDLLTSQLPAVPAEHILVEPVNRNTAPSVAWATDLITHSNPDANVLVTPSDQLVLNEDAFARYVDVGMGYVAENNVLLAMGVKPTRPEPGYGYIQLGDLSCKPDVYKVKSFTEKPEREFARMFMESGEFYWNTGIFMAKGIFLLKSFEGIFPEVLRNLKFEKPDYTYDDSVEYCRERYPYYPNLSLDYAILEQCKGVFVMKCDFGWADIGTWHAIYEYMQKTENDNVVLDSEVILENAQNNIIKLPKGHIAVINGLDGYIIAEQGDVLLICPKEDSSALIRKYVNEVGIKYGEEYT
jgi:mannose-1-phosphate guanylyltransferase